MEKEVALALYLVALYLIVIIIVIIIPLFYQTNLWSTISVSLNNITFPDFPEKFYL